MLACQRHLFSLPEQVVYLNCAYMSPQLKAVEAAGRHALVQKNEPFKLSVNDFFEPVDRVRQLYARLIRSSEAGRIAVLPAVSYGMAIVARNLPLGKGQNIVIAEEQFPSNYYAWQRLATEKGAELRVVGPPDRMPRSTAWNEQLLEAIDKNTAMLAIANVHWADGTLFDLPALRARTREVGAWMVIDGTQSIGSLPIDVDALQPDALIAAGYKCLMGPYATALGYFGPVFDQGVPIEENWINRLQSEDFRGLVNYQQQYKPLASRYNVGEHSNFILIPMLEAALMQVMAWGPNNIQEYCRELNRPYLGLLEEIGVVLEPEGQRAHHLLGLRLGDAFDLDRLQQILAERHIYVSIRGQSVRVSPHLYNRITDWARLVEAIRLAKR